ncbi:MAG TPA: transcription antitermination factor NusB [Nitrospirae bacterium]|nr:transcription antitermination factor NusB [Nitrospirota bacterium]HDZ84390.1 transcription antitermination factor NusB [Nitrospirota bacterium]
MKRRRSREYALQILFQLELTGAELNDDILIEFWKGIDNEPDDLKDFAHRIVRETLVNRDKIDEIIIKAAQNWSLERMAVIDRNILRAATYELSFRKDIPNSVAINEAIEIAKKFSTEESASFINGILDKIANKSKKVRTSTKR